MECLAVTFGVVRFISTLQLGGPRGMLPQKIFAI